MSRLFASVLMAAVAAAAVAPASAQVYGNYGNGYNLPQGSYLQSCTNITVRGSMLRATCTEPNGQTMRTSIDVNQCGGRDILNNNGALACGNGQYNYTTARAYGRRYRQRYYNGNYNYNNGYNNGGFSIPPGSYQASCTNMRMVGASVLQASCTAPNGARITSTINVRRCYNDVRNDNGYLRC